MTRSVFCFLGGYLFGFHLWAQAPKYSNEFLSIGVGADAFGRASSVVATTQGAEAGFWNPSGLLNTPGKFDITAMHAEYFAGIAKFDYVAGAHNLDSASAIGISFIRFGIDDIPNTIDLIDQNGNVNYDNITSFSAADYAFLVSYARRGILKHVDLGASAKIIHRKVGAFASAWGFGIDLGLQYHKNNLSIGVLAKDITTTVNAWSYRLDDRTQEVFTLTGNEIPQNGTEITLPKFIFGAAYRFHVGDKIGILPEINIDLTTDGKRNVLINGDPLGLDPHLGVELDYKKLAYLRFGFGNIQRQTNDIGNREFLTIQPNMGIGVKIQDLSIDYALTDIGDVAAGLYSHVFSLSYTIK